MNEKLMMFKELTEAKGISGNEKEARDSTRRANEDQPGCVYDAEADKNGRKKSPFSFFDDIDEDEI